LEVSRLFCQNFFAWYNLEHRHSGIAYLSPARVHYGQAQQIIAARQEVLQAAYSQHPERFVKQPPLAAPLPKAVWINPPAPDQERSFKPLH
jgi:putative transposase